MTSSFRADCDVPIEMRDGVVLRADITVLLTIASIPRYCVAPMPRGE